jgi:hypothetical protein
MGRSLGRSSGRRASSRTSPRRETGTGSQSESARHSITLVDDLLSHRDDDGYEALGPVRRRRVLSVSTKVSKGRPAQTVALVVAT